MDQTAALAYSAEVSARLQVGAVEHDVAQTGPDFLILRQPAELPAGEASLILNVEARTSTTAILLPEGASRTSLKVKFRVVTQSIA